MSLRPPPTVTPVAPGKQTRLDYVLQVGCGGCGQPSCYDEIVKILTSMQKDQIITMPQMNEFKTKLGPMSSEDREDLKMNLRAILVDASVANKKEMVMQLFPDLMQP